MTRRTWRERIAYRSRLHTRQAIVALAGRPVRCAECGRVMFRALTFVHRGRVHVFGALEYNVRIAFADKERIEFRHLELDKCPAPARPWVR
jgi:hypothetical protein